MDLQSATHQTITYFVNGESETTDQGELTVRAILEGAGLAPATDYVLMSENPPKDYGTNYDELVRLHEHERFLGLFKAPTPTS